MKNKSQKQAVHFANQDSLGLRRVSMTLPILLIVVTFFWSVFSLGFGGFSKAAPVLAAEKDTQEILLHKRLFLDQGKGQSALEHPWHNTGGLLPVEEEHPLLTQAIGENGATFLLVDVTAYYFERCSQLSIEEAENWLNQQLSQKMLTEHLATKGFNQEIFVEAEYAPIRILQKGTTSSRTELPVPLAKDQTQDEEGLLLFQGVPKTSGGRSAMYYIVELTSSKTEDEELARVSSRLLLSFPVVDERGQAFSGEYLHLYPKTALYGRSPWFMKVGSGNEGDLKTLAGAQFALYRLNQGEKEYFLPSTTGNPQEHQWLSNVSKNQERGTVDQLTAQKIPLFVSDAQGIVSLKGLILAGGTYYFEEVQAAPGYLLTNDTKAIEVVIPMTGRDEQGNPLGITIAGQKMTEPQPDFTQLKETSISAAEVLAQELSAPGGLPKILNEKIPQIKKVLRSSHTDFDWGATIDYRITTQLPQNPQEFEAITLVDEATEGLRFIPESLKVSIAKGDALSPEQTKALLKVETRSDGRGFQGSLQLDYLAQQPELASRTLILDYQMELTANALGDEWQENEASLIYRHNQQEYRLLGGKTRVTTGGHHFRKVDLANDAPLAQGEFYVKNAAGQYYEKTETGVRWVPTANQATLLKSQVDGSFSIEGVAYGEYQLIEHQAPTGYQLLQKPVPFQVEGGSWKQGGRSAEPLKIGNIQQRRDGLPGTGSTGTTVKKELSRSILPKTGSVNQLRFIGMGLFLLGLGILSYWYRVKGRKKSGFIRRG